MSGRVIVGQSSVLIYLKIVSQQNCDPKAYACYNINPGIAYDEI